jgi:drug/metabolite transporter (DMT)-like permease
MLLIIIIFNIRLPGNNLQILYLAISGFLGLNFGDSFLFKSYQYQSPRISMLLLSISPAITAIIAYFALQEDLSLIAILGMFATLFGIVLVILKGNSSNSENSKFNMKGVFYGLMAAFGQAGSVVFARLAFTQGEMSGFVATFIRIFSSLIFLIPITIVLGKFSNPAKVFIKDKKVLYLTLLGAFLGPFLGINFSLLSIMYTKAAISSTLIATTPIPMLILVRIFDKEIITWRAILGTFIAVGGVAILFLR